MELRRNAFDAVVRSRALVLDEMAGTRHRTVASANDPDVSRAGGRSRRSPRRSRHDVSFVALAGTAPEGAYKSLVLTARQRRDRAEQSLAEKSLAFRNEQRRNLANLDDVRTALSAGRRVGGESSATATIGWRRKGRKENC